MFCHSCQHRRVRVEKKSGSSVIVWGCIVKKIRFGYQWEFEKGKNMPENCTQYHTDGLEK